MESQPTATSRRWRTTRSRKLRAPPDQGRPAGNSSRRRPSRWVCRSVPPSIRVSMCLPGRRRPSGTRPPRVGGHVTGTPEVAGHQRPGEGGVASAGPTARRCLPQASVIWRTGQALAGWAAGQARWVEPGSGLRHPVEELDRSPSARSTASRPSRPSRTASASASAAGWMAPGHRSTTAATCRRARRTATSSPSTRTTSAPALRPWPMSLRRACVRPGQRRAVRVRRVGRRQHEGSRRPRAAERGIVASGRPRRARRTARRRAPRRSSRGGSGRSPRTPSAPGRPRRSRPARARP